MSIISRLMNRAVGLTTSGLRSKKISMASNMKSPVIMLAAAIGDRASSRRCNKATAPNAKAIVVRVNMATNSTAVESTKVSFSAAVSLAFSI